jgi:hypothetical protein
MTYNKIIIVQTGSNILESNIIKVIDNPNELERTIPLFEEIIISHKLYEVVDVTYDLDVNEVIVIVEYASTINKG